MIANGGMLLLQLMLTFISIKQKVELSFGNSRQLLEELEA